VSDSVEIDLLQRAAAGDYDAFDQLHLLLEPSIRRFVMRLVGYQNSEVDDIVQDTFLSLYLNMRKIDPPENLRPYTFRIARNRCYDLLRRLGRFDPLSLDEEPVRVRVSFDHAERHQTGPEETAHWLLLQLEVREAMDDLPELQRQTLILFAEENMTYAEIAEVMDVSIGTVKSRLFHAKQTLRRLVRPETMEAIMETPSPEPPDPAADGDKKAVTDTGQSAEVASTDSPTTRQDAPSAIHTALAG
jgi:RNA polymerase sigma-70 factor (ECF subfamily)